MKVTEHIKQAEGKTLFSFEILPPKKGENLDSILKNTTPLLKYSPSFIDVTYHREEHEYIERPDGLLEKKIVKKRPGTVGTCAIIQHKFGIDAIPHILCGGFNQEETENLLIDLDFIGINNIMALRGDSLKSETYFKPEKDGHHFASELVKQVIKLNNGTYLDSSLKNPAKTNFQIGVAGYPEKHMEAASLEQDLKFLKNKVDAGADYIVTQMFFDNQKYFDFVKKCRSLDINIPIIPGLKPFSTQRQLSLIPHRFHIDLPNELIKNIDNCKTNKEVKQVGIEWCIKQCEELKEFGVPALHFYSMGKSDNIEAVVKEFFD